MQICIRRKVDKQIVVNERLGTGSDIFTAEISCPFADIAAAKKRRSSLCGGSAEKFYFHKPSPKNNS